jgi:hypothetical protein
MLMLVLLQKERFLPLFETTKEKMVQGLLTKSFSKLKRNLEKKFLKLQKKE